MLCGSSARSVRRIPVVRLLAGKYRSPRRRSAGPVQDCSQNARRRCGPSPSDPARNSRSCPFFVPVIRHEREKCRRHRHQDRTKHDFLRLLTHIKVAIAASARSPPRDCEPRTDMATRTIATVAAACFSQLLSLKLEPSHQRQRNGKRQSNFGVPAIKPPSGPKHHPAAAVRNGVEPSLDAEIGNRKRRDQHQRSDP